MVQPLSVVRRGSPATFELVRDEVRQRLRVEEHRKRYDDLLGTLRKRYNVEVLLSPGESADTAQVQSHE